MGDSKRARRGYASGKDDYLTRLAKIEGQVRGLRKMIEDDRWCPDVVTQVSSVTRALQEVAVGLLTDHIHCCVVDAVRRSPIDGQEALDEVASTIRQVMSL
jgi:DNA-binding FrmR family transcriptional regulator